MRLAKAAILGAFTCIAAPAALAQEQPVKKPAPKIAFAPVMEIGRGYDPGSPRGEDSAEQIGAVIIRGNEAIDGARYQEIVEGFFGQPRTDEVLSELTNELAELARESGYPYVRAELSRDALERGFVQIDLDEGRVDAVEIDGYQNAHALRVLNKLVGGPVRKSQLERSLLLVSDIPAVRLRGAKLRRRDGQSILVVKLSRIGTSGRLDGDNYGTESFGPLRLRLSGQSHASFTSGDTARASVRINPVDVEELFFFSGSYGTQVGTGGTFASASASIGRTAPGGALEGSDISGDSVRLRVSVSQPIIRSKAVSLWAEASGNYLSIDQDDLDTMLRDDTIVTASLGLRAQIPFAGGRLRGGATHVRGLGILGATRLGDPNASRFDGDGVFSKVEFWADARIPVAERLQLYLAANGQIADRPLLASEELSLGGAYRTRGYDFSEVLGDEGVYGLAELRYSLATTHLPADFLQLYAFIDGGYVSDIDGTGSEGSLFSAGPGVRARFGVFDLEVESGFPLGGSGERSTSDDPEINVRAGVRF